MNHEHVISLIKVNVFMQVYKLLLILHPPNIYIGITQCTHSAAYFAGMGRDIDYLEDEISYI